MPKFFVISDIHGYYDEMKKALDKAGFDPENEEHWLITCGDHFDRGHQPLQVMEYLQSLPRKVLIKGNHESLLLDCLQRGYAERHDWSNGTAQSIIDIAYEAETFGSGCIIAYERVKDFIYSMVDYYETANYIFVHSWIPAKCNDNLPVYYTKNRKFEFNPDWREAHHSEWEQARWNNPYKMVEDGLLPDKTVVFGHWHTSYPRSRYENKPEWGEDANFSIYNGDGYIAIDGCTAYSGQVNVLVIEDDFLK